MEHGVAEHGVSERLACRGLGQYRFRQRKKPTTGNVLSVLAGHNFRAFPRSIAVRGFSVREQACLMTRTARPRSFVKAKRPCETSPCRAASLPDWVKERAINARHAPRPSRIDKGNAEALQASKFFTLAEAAGILRVSQRTVRRLVRSGELSCVRVRRSVRISVAALEAFYGNQGSGISSFNDSS